MEKYGPEKIRELVWKKYCEIALRVHPEAAEEWARDCVDQIERMNAWYAKKANEQTEFEA